MEMDLVNVQGWWIEPLRLSHTEQPSLKELPWPCWTRVYRAPGRDSWAVALGHGAYETFRALRLG